MMTIWFPGDLFFMDGGWQGLKIIAPIDLVLGPALTLIFYRPWKKSIKLDMSMIATVQILALGFGVYTAYQQRTAAIVFAESRFETISYNEVKAANKEMMEQDLPVKSLQDFGKMPVLVYATPFDKDGYGQYLAELLNGLPELRERTARYLPISDAPRVEMVKWAIENPASDTALEIPASSKENPALTAQAAPETYTLKAKYADGIIKFNGSNYKIQRNGRLFADH